MPEIQFQNLDMMDALDLAILIEEEAKERYEEFVEQLGARYPGDASDVFAQMAKYEEEHHQQLLARRIKLFANKPVRVNRDMIWDVEAPSPSGPRTYMSPYQAMEIALEGEKKAHEFFCQALKVVTNQEVRILFEELRDEELAHQALLAKWMKKHDNDGPDRDDDGIDDPPAL